MTSSLKLSFAQTGIIGKIDPGQMAWVIGQSGDASALLDGNADFHQIVCGGRNGRIRISLVHFNDESDVHALIQMLREVSSR